ncbi:MAG: hypothetical protein E6Q44_15315 [Flavobacteriales bacterium]|nr:MAG: hypothetical protein E6Q44_15315 [Flavobacteriales bacterium]
MSSDASIEKVTTAAGWLLGLACVLLLHRYVGIVHDSVLYLGQVLWLRRPEVFGSDLFFAFGSQADLSPFPRLLDLAVGNTPFATFFLWGTLVSLLAFAFAGWYCLRGALPSGQRYAAFLGVACLPSIYGRGGAYHYGEPYFTSRTLGEAMCLVALGLLVRQRPLAAFAVLAMAVPIHPLQALAGGMIAWIFAVMQDRRWVHLAWLGLAAPMLAVLQVAPFDGLFQRIDSSWLMLLVQHGRNLFLQTWDWLAMNLLAFDVAILVLAWRMLPAPFATLCKAGLVGLGIGMLASLVLADGFALHLPLILQTWRVHWLAHWLAMAAIGALLARDIRTGDPLRAIALGFACVLMWQAILWWWVTAMVAYVTWPRWRGPHAGFIRRALAFLLAGVTLILFLNAMSSDFLYFRIAHYRLDLFAFDRKLLAFPVLALGLALLGVEAWLRARARGRWLLLALCVLPAVVAGAVRWDARPPITLAMERSEGMHERFGRTLPPDAHVYWDAEWLLGPWLILGRPSYYNGLQLAGQSFNRGTTFEGIRRSGVMQPLQQDSQRCQSRDLPLEERERCHIGHEALRQACAPPDGGGGPDYLVLSFDQPQPALGRWDIHDPVTGQVAITWRLYACNDILRTLGI